jgi:hypothetical protein
VKVLQQDGDFADLVNVVGVKGRIEQLTIKRHRPASRLGGLARRAYA